MTNELRLSESEYKLLKSLAGRVHAGVKYSVEDLARLAGMDRSSVEAIIRLLSSKGIVVVEDYEETIYEVSSEAEKYVSDLFPEEKLVKHLGELGGRASVEVLKEVLGAELNIALPNALRKGWVRVNEGIVELLVDPSRAVAEERKYIEALKKGEKLGEDILRLLRRRKLIERVKRRLTWVTFKADPSVIVEKAVVEIGALTHDMLVSGEWQRFKLREYDITAEPPRLRLGRLNFFLEFIEYIRDVMKELGFVEVEAPPIELEFWNYDVLFQPQYHPARRPTDTFYLENPKEGLLPAQLVLRVKAVHENGAGISAGWNYKWDQRIAARLILRSHTTAVSARVLAQRPKPPFRFFTIGRVYRVEKVDAKHLPEFHQVDGIASEEGVDVRWLIGFLSEFLERLGFKEYKFRPAYFPFTEPSIEGYVKVKDVWMEVLGAGLFRPEVLHPMGIDYPVAAWGMGIERLAMALYELADIRMLYSDDTKIIEYMPVRWWLYAGLTL